MPNTPQTLEQLAQPWVLQAIVTTQEHDQDGTILRVRATCEAFTFAVPWDDELGTQQNHCRAALRLMREIGWYRVANLVCGQLPGPAVSFAFVQVPKSGQ